MMLNISLNIHAMSKNLFRYLESQCSDIMNRQISFIDE